MLGSTAAVGILFAGATTVQSVLALGIFSQVLRGTAPEPTLEIVTRGIVNLATAAVLVGLVAILAPERRRPALRMTLTLVIAASAAVFRALAQLVAGVYAPSAGLALVTEIGTTAIAAVATLLIGFALVAAWGRLQTVERQRASSELEARLAYAELQDEELRVRREVAHGIHGSVQNVFVVLEAELNDTARRLAPDDAERIRRAAETVRGLREGELRSLSSVLYPVDLDRGLDPALTALVVRLPAHVAVELDFHEAARALDADRLPFDTRLLLVRVVEEALTNAVGHGDAHRIRFALEGGAGSPTIRVTLDDDGIGLGPHPVRSGLHRLGRQVELLGGVLDLVPSPVLSGARLHAIVPRDDTPAAARV